MRGMTGRTTSLRGTGDEGGVRGRVRRDVGGVRRFVPPHETSAPRAPPFQILMVHRLTPDNHSIQKRRATHRHGRHLATSDGHRNRSMPPPHHPSGSPWCHPRSRWGSGSVGTGRSSANAAMAWPLPRSRRYLACRCGASSPSDSKANSLRWNSETRIWPAGGQRWTPHTGRTSGEGLSDRRGGGTPVSLRIV